MFTCAIHVALLKPREFIDGHSVREFLIAKFGEGPIDASRIVPADPICFITRRARHCRPGSTQVIANSFKSFLRYQQLLGRCKPVLITAIPRIPEYRLATLPMVLSDAQTERSLRRASHRLSPATRPRLPAMSGGSAGFVPMKSHTFSWLISIGVGVFSDSERRRLHQVTVADRVYPHPSRSRLV